jgi:bla regulator protein BlaR1
MINWLIAQQLGLSIMLVTLLILERKGVAQVGGRFAYLMWFALPLLLILNQLPSLMTSNISPQIYQYLVQFNPDMSSSTLSVNWLWCWALGAGFVISLSLISHRKMLAQVCKHALPIQLDASPEQQAKLGHAPRGLTALPIYTSTKISSPMLIGIINPCILLPANYASLYSQEQLNLILEHELCHFSRKDNLSNLVAIGLLSLFWFNPLSWLGYQSFRRLQEVACDETVLQQKNSKQRLAYSKAMLISIENQNFNLYSYTYYTEKDTMLTRLKHIKNHSQAQLGAKLASGLLLSGLLATVAIAGQPQAIESNKAEKAQAHIMPLTRVEPKYPISAANNKQEGSVVLKFDISPSGAVSNITVVNSEPQGIFDKQASIALAQWQYESSATGQKNALVQLDFAMDAPSTASSLVEQIQVTH